MRCRRAVAAVEVTPEEIINLRPMERLEKKKGISTYDVRNNISNFALFLCTLCSRILG